MRLFIAIDFQTLVKDVIISYCNELKKFIPSARLVNRNNIHITLKFLGETPAIMLPQIKQSMDASFNGIDGFSITSTEIGSFSSGNSHILWIGLKHSEELQQVANICDISMEKLGFAPENRAFTPHITLAREALLTLPISKLIESLPPLQFDAKINAITLFESRYENNTLIYAPLHCVKLM